MVDTKQHVQDTLVAINSVRRRLKLATERGQTAEAYKLMGDLIQLCLCLEGDTQKLIDEMDLGAYSEFMKKSA